MATSIRIVNEASFSPIASSITALSGGFFPEPTMFVNLYNDSASTDGFFVCEVGSANPEGGIFVAPGQSLQLGPFLLANVPAVYTTGSCTIFYSFLPVVSES
jgi:hypothetical protein